MRNWEDWKPDTSHVREPYVNWFKYLHPEHLIAEHDPPFKLQVAPTAADYSGFLAATNRAAGVLDLISRGDLGLEDLFPPVETMGDADAALLGGQYDLFPVPSFMHNPAFLDYWNNRADKTSWLPANLPIQPIDPRLSKNPILAGIIDVDIALGHRRLRNADGTTRVRAAWQQGASPDAWKDWNDNHLPYGATLYKHKIDELLLRHSGCDLTRSLDEEAFNREAGLVQMDELDGRRALAGREAHRTHVLGLFAGADPVLQEEFSRNVHLLVVNLPPEVAFGEGGTFLDYYLVFALRWLFEMQDRIRRNSGLDDLPMMINISFGKQAGAKDDRQVLVGEFKDAKGNPLPFNCAVAAGNDNLARCNARLVLQKGDERALTWRIQPDDETSNFVEIWSEGEHPKGAVKPPLAIDVVPLGKGPDGFTLPESRMLRGMDDGSKALIYFEPVPAKETGEVRFRYVICLAPDRMEGGVPAGAWTIRFRNETEGKIVVRASIQSDQATLPGRRQARRSYFEAPDYAYVEPSGRIADSYAHDPDGPGARDIDKAEDLKRHGTVNSYAATPYVAAIAGYRRTDGLPDPVSATGIGDNASRDESRRPTAAYPTDDGYAHFGQLSDGAADGSVVAMTGTSVACAGASRRVIEEWLADRGPTEDAAAILERLATAEEPERRSRRFPLPAAKLGKGRLRPSKRSEVGRFSAE